MHVIALLDNAEILLRMPMKEDVMLPKIDSHEVFYARACPASEIPYFVCRVSLIPAASAYACISTSPVSTSCIHNKIHCGLLKHIRLGFAWTSDNAH